MFCTTLIVLRWKVFDFYKGPLSGCTTVRCSYMIAQPDGAAFTSFTRFYKTNIFHSHASVQGRTIKRRKSKAKFWHLSLSLLHWLPAAVTLHVFIIHICLTVSFSSSFLAGSKVWWGRYELANQTLHWLAEISLSVRGDHGDGRLWTQFTCCSPQPLAASASGFLSELGGNMKVNFAPLDLPLNRRLQTASVLQWVFSFLGLGE